MHGQPVRFGKILRESRKLRDRRRSTKSTTQAWLAKKLNVSRSTVGRWESPGADPLAPPEDKATIDEIADVLEMDERMRAELWESAAWAWLEHKAPDVFALLSAQIDELTQAIEGTQRREAEIRADRVVQLSMSERSALAALRRAQRGDARARNAAVGLSAWLEEEGAERSMVLALSAVLMGLGALSDRQGNAAPKRLLLAVSRLDVMWEMPLVLSLLELVAIYVRALAGRDGDTHAGRQFLQTEVSRLTWQLGSRRREVDPALDDGFGALMGAVRATMDEPGAVSVELDGAGGRTRTGPRGVVSVHTTRNQDEVVITIKQDPHA